MTEVRTRDEAISMVGQAMGAWSVNLTGVLARSRAVAQAALSEAERVVRRCANEVAAIEAHMRAAPEERQPQLAVQHNRSREALEQAERVRLLVADLAARILQLERAHSTTSMVQVERARAQLSAMGLALDGYRSGGSGSGSGSIVRGAPRSAGGGSLVMLGLADVDVDAADLADNPVLDDNRQNGTFGKGGLTRADYRWAVQTWNDTVGPGVACGKTRDDFAERDAQSNAAPLRRTADVYDMFLGSDRIRADRRPDGSLDIINGRHRLLIAKELGIKSLPGHVSG